MTVFHSVGYGRNDDIKNSRRPYLYITEQNNFNMSPIKVTSGRFPKQQDEIVLTTKFLETSGANYKIGDVITLEMGNRFTEEDGHRMELNQKYPHQQAQEQFEPTGTKQYKVVGIIEYHGEDGSRLAGYPAFSYLEPQPGNSYAVTINFKTINKKIFETTKALSKKTGKSNIKYNEALLIYSGLSSDSGLLKTIQTMVGIIGMIILIGSVSLIYNAFAISLSERSKTLGMLASVGTTKRQKRNSVLFEAFAIGIVAIPLGLLFGLLGIGITFHFVSPLLQNITGLTQELYLAVTPSAVIGSILFASVILYISAWIPAKRASRITPIEAIRQTQDIKVRKKDIKTSKITRKLFGFEAELGLKNLKRNKNRYLATLFSLIISVILFLSASCFSFYMKKSFDMAQAPINYDMSVSVYNTGTKADEVRNQVKTLSGVKKPVETQEISSTTYLSKDQIDPFTLKSAEKVDGKYIISIPIVALDEQHFASYCQEVGITPDEVNSKPMQGILLNKLIVREKNSFHTITPVKAEAGDSLDLRIYGKEGDIIQTKLNIAKTTDKVLPRSNNFEESPAISYMIVSEKTMNQLFEEAKQKKVELNGYYSIKFDIDDADQMEKEIDVIISSHPEIQIGSMNIKKDKQLQEQMLLLTSIFLYGFIILIAIISIANIINTISTGMRLYKREFAMIKSIGITPRGFKKMIYFESLFYGIKALLYGLPISFIIMFIMYNVLQLNFNFDFTVPWKNIAIAIIGVFTVVGTTMLYASRKMKHENIVDVLKNENL